MKAVAPLLTLSLALAAVPPPQKPRAPEALFGAAQHQEEVQGNLEAAIAGYNRVLAAAGSNRALAARAQYRIGLCYERLGNQEARRAFERVIREFADQRELADQARARLATLNELTPATAGTGVVARQLWTGREVDVSGGLSADGRLLSFTDWSTGDLAIRDVTAGTNRRLTDKGDWAKSSDFAEFSAISRDSGKVAYAWFDSPAEWYELRLVSSGGGQWRTVVRRNDMDWVRPVAWFPEGKELVMQCSNPGGGEQIGIVTVADGSWRKLKDVSGRRAWVTSISPDGRYILYDAGLPDRPQQRAVYILSRDGELDAPLIEEIGVDGSAYWMPDGRTVLFMTSRSGRRALWGIHVQNGRAQTAPELVRNDMGQVTPVGTASDGSYFYGVQAGLMDVFIAETDPTTARVASKPLRASTYLGSGNSRPAWSPDGERLAYISTDRRVSPGGLPTITVKSMGTGEEKEISPTIRVLRMCLRWFPDGQSLLAVAQNPRNGIGFYRVELATGKSTPIGEWAPADVSLQADVLPDGRQIIFTRVNRETKSTQVLLRDVQTGQERQVASIAPGYRARRGLALSPDGRSLALLLEETGRSFRTLNVLSLDTGEMRELFRPAAPEMFGVDAEWTTDSRSILCFLGTTMINRTQTLVRIALDGGTPERLITLEGLGAVSVRRDGKRIAFNAGNPRRELWVLRDLNALLAKR